MRLSILFLILGLKSCTILGGKDEPTAKDLPEFISTPVISQVNANHLDEVSGIVPSFSFPNHVWLMEDSDTEPKIDLVRNDGTYVRKVTFNGRNRDWEGIAIGPGPEANKKYIYLGEIGDNSTIFTDYYIYRFEEPSGNQTHIQNYDTIRFRYPNNESLNSETLMIDPLTKDLYIVTKDQINVRVYKLPYPQNTQDLNEAQFLGTIKFWGIVAGDISVDGSEILLKSYPAVYYWKRRKNETVFQALSRVYDINPPYVIEPQGEAICWDVPAKGYFTMSEKASAARPPLYYFKKKGFD